jgi:outer membrane lipoprotein-sorting protein
MRAPTEHDMTGIVPQRFWSVLVGGLLAVAAPASAQTPVPPAPIPSVQSQPASSSASARAPAPKAKPAAAKTAQAKPAQAKSGQSKSAQAKPKTQPATAAPKRTTVATPAAKPKPSAPKPVAAPKPAPVAAAAVASPAATPSLAQASSPAARPGSVGQAGRAPVPVAPNTRNVTRPGSAGFDSSQRELVQKVSAYLSAMQTLVGNFVQVGPDGSRTTGDFYIQKPGRVRFEYDAPSPISLIADGSSIAVRDRKLATQDIIPLSQTPLRFLLADRIDLLRDAQVVGVHADDVFVTVVIEEKSNFVGTHRLMLMFGAKDLQLRQWTVTDPQGFDTTVAVYNLDPSKRPDPSLFKIDYTRYQ